MFKKITFERILLAGIIAFYFYFLFIYDMHKNEKWLNDAICNLVKQKVNAKVQNKGGHGRYNWFIVHDSIKYYYQISEVVISPFKKNTIYIKVGDSIVKDVNSKKITVYRGDKKSIYLLRCED